MKKEMSDKKAAAVAIGGLIAMGAIATAPIGAPLTILGASINPFIWGIVGGASIGVISTTANKSKGGEK